MIGLLVLIGIVIFNKVKIANLERRLSASQVDLLREIKMINHASLGLGRRFSEIEKRLKSPAKVNRDEQAMDFKTIQQMLQPNRPESGRDDQSSRPSVSVQLEPVFNSRAEKSLSLWINEHQPARVNSR